MRCRTCFSLDENVDVLAARAVSVDFEKEAESITVKLTCPHGAVVMHRAFPGTASYPWSAEGLNRQEANAEKADTCPAALLHE